MVDVKDAEKIREDEDEDDGDDVYDNVDDMEEEDDDGIAYNYQPITSTSVMCPDLPSALKYDLEHSGFDILSHLKRYYEDDMFEHHGIVLINQCRAFVRSLEGKEEEEGTEAKAIGEKLNEFILECDEKKKTRVGVRGDEDEDEDNSSWFRPVLEDDALLMHLEELHRLLGNAKLSLSSDDGCALSTGKKLSFLENDGKDEWRQREEDYRDRISALESQLQLAQDCLSNQRHLEEVNSDQDHPSHQLKKQEEADVHYFGSYSHVSIHETMIRDTVRTIFYRECLSGGGGNNLVLDRVVLDVGCGMTAILSLFAARGGAKKVYALEASADAARVAKTVVAENGYADVIEVIHTTVEAWNGPTGTIDIIVSEWMGYALFFESMFPSVLHARDSFLSSSSASDQQTQTSPIMVPNRATLFMEGATDVDNNGRDRLEYWDDVYGFCMKGMRHAVVEALMEEAVVETVPSEHIVTDRCSLWKVDLDTVTIANLASHTSDFVLRVRESMADGLKETPPPPAPVKIHKLVVSFDVSFLLDTDDDEGLHLRTGPAAPPTHWKQTSLWIKDGPVVLNQDEELVGTFCMSQNVNNKREIDFDVRWKVRAVHTNPNTLQSGQGSNGRIRYTMKT